jgi:hypothetical protein
MKEAEVSVIERSDHGDDRKGSPGRRAGGVAGWAKARPSKTREALQCYGGPVCH